MIRDLNDLEIYQEGMRLGEEVWTAVAHWDSFAKRTVGQQLVRSTDSIAANLAEGHGRYHFKENQKFCYYSRGSLEETRTWITKAVNRSLIPRNHGTELQDDLESLLRRMNSYIRSIGSKE